MVDWGKEAVFVIAYHIDRAGYLRQFSCLNGRPLLGRYPHDFAAHFPLGSSRFGDQYLHWIFRGNPEGDSNTQIELDFELVRMEQFPDLPSRQSCLFASPSLDDLLQYWGSLIGPKTKIWKVVSLYDGALRDASLLLRYPRSSGARLSPRDAGYKEICKYWEGVLGPDSRPELLLPYPIFVESLCTL